MPQLMGVILDGETYRVRVRADLPLEESFHIEQGENYMVLLNGEESPDVLGTYYNHTLYVEPDPRYFSDYDAFYQAISAPVDFHTITMPHGQTTLTYKAKVVSGSHKLRGVIAGQRRYYGLQVNFQATAPQREPED